MSFMLDGAVRKLSRSNSCAAKTIANGAFLQSTTTLHGDITIGQKPLREVSTEGPALGRTRRRTGSATRFGLPVPLQAPRT